MGGAVDVAALDRFEEFFERIVEGTIMRFFRSPIQPAEIGRKLERAMEDGRVAAVGAPLVPNDYHAEMHPRDMLAFADFVLPLSRQMGSWLAEEIKNRGYHTLGAVRVRITGNDRAPRRSILVTARVMAGTDRSSAEADRLQRTEVYRVIRDSGGVPPHVIQLLNGAGSERVFTVRSARTTIGRGLDNDLVLESTDVSRHHARLEFADDRYHLIDLGSTNGTRVNGRQVRRAELQDGDEIELGSLHLRFLPYQTSPDGRWL